MSIKGETGKNLSSKKKTTLSVRDIALIGMMTAILEVCKMALSFLPNIEIVTFLIIMFTLFFGYRVFYAVIAFILIEISVYGIHVWVIMYIYMWPLLVFITIIFRKKDTVWFFSILSGMFGLLFGFFCAIPYFFIGCVDGSIQSGFIMAFNWWIAGIPFDLIHGIANFVIMLVLYHPIKALLHRLYPLYKEGKK